MGLDTWIISESDDVTARVRKALQKLDAECPLARVVSAASVGEIAQHFTEPSAVVFFATADLSPIHLDTLRYLRSASVARVVVVSPIPDHATVLKAIRAGASDYLNADGNLDEEIADVVSRFRSERSQQAAKGRLITIVPCHVQSDASMLAVNVSAVIARHAGACGLIDLQLRGGDLAILLKLSPRHTLYDLITQRDGVDETMFQQALTRHESGIQLLAGPPLFSNLANIQPFVCQQVLGLAQSSHSYVVVNSEDVLHKEQVQALVSSDDVVLTTRLDLVSLSRAQQHLEHFRRNNIPTEHIHIVAMNTGHAGELPVHAVKKVLAVPTIHCIPDDPVSSTVSINVGNPLVLEAPRSKVARVLIKLAETISGLPKVVTQEAHRDSTFGIRAATFLPLVLLCFYI